jgi:transcriptional regulator with XRE-family HTH domain
MAPTESTGRRLRLVREAQGRSLRDVAKEAGIDHAHLSRVERGLRVPSVQLLVRLGRILGLRNLVEAGRYWESDSDV